MSRINAFTVLVSRFGVGDAVLNEMINNKALRLMRRGAEHRLKFVESCGGDFYGGEMGNFGSGLRNWRERDKVVFC